MAKHMMPFGAQTTPEGVRFALWAPNAKAVTLVYDDQALAMPEAADGWRCVVAPDAKAGSTYAFRIDDDLLVPDPASRHLPDANQVHSFVVDPDEFEWTSASWKGRLWQETVIYETHVGTATKEGTYLALGGKLEELRDRGITAIELLPLAACPGTRNWGYDGVFLYAPQPAYGTPNDLKGLIDKAHRLGIMMFLDVVYNHFGPSGNYLHHYAEGFYTDKHHTPWGNGLNFDGGQARIVRDFFIHNALYWLEEFQFDGLRFDAVQAILDSSEPHILNEIAGRIRSAFPDRHIHLMLENENNCSSLLARDAAGSPKNYDAQWNDDIHHCWHRLLTGESESYYSDFGGDVVERLGRCLAEGFDYQGQFSKNLGRPRGEVSKGLPPDAFVAFLQNHDQIGNRAQGERLTQLADPAKLSLARALLLLSPQIPLLFMGEDWGSVTPFQFFVDFSHDPALSQAVRDGRKKEFAAFKSFNDENKTSEIPDPTALSTFVNSTLEWDKAEVFPHAPIAKETRHLLALRAEQIIPLLKSGFVSSDYHRVADGGLDVTWIFGDGQLEFLMNFGAGARNILKPKDAILWSNLGLSTADYEAVSKQAGIIELQPWTAVVTKGPAA